MSSAELKDTEQAHKDALTELQAMKQTMEKMEEERSEMIAEVEAQIERALESMAVDMDESDYGSRPSSRMSSRSAPSTYRRPSDHRQRGLRSFSTESTLADSYEGDGREETGKTGVSDTLVEEPEEEEDVQKKKKRFSADHPEMPQDGMTAVDEGISQKSDKIAQKVLQIQRKVSPESSMV